MVNIFTSKISSDGSSWTNWMVIPAAQAEGMSERELFAEAGMCESYHGAGAAFSRQPYIRRSPSRVLLVQDCGYDI